MSRKKQGFVHVYTGNGKGKTTAALGLALRALGHQKKVCLVQFMKQGNFGEIKALRKFSNILIKQFGTKKLVRKEKISLLDRKEADLALHFSQKVIKGRYDMVILDEIIVAVYFGLVDEKKLLEIIKTRPKKLELILTGRCCSAKLKNTADLVTEMKEIKHYYQHGRKARIGIEY